MTAAPELPPLTPPVPPKSWRVTVPRGEPRDYEAAGFRVEGGALVLLLPAGCVAAFAPGQWLTVESAATELKPLSTSSMKD